MADALKCDRCGGFYTFDDKSLRPSANKKIQSWWNLFCADRRGLPF